MTIKRNVLLNPGPATTTDSVKNAQVVPDICPRENEFGDVMEFISKGLSSIVSKGEDYETILYGGSGTAAVEAVISSVINDNDVILIINNGAYGKRMCEIADIYKLKYVEFKSSPIKRIDLNLLNDIIANFDSVLCNEVKYDEIVLHNMNNDKGRDLLKITHLAVVHHETTTGLLNNILEIGEICRKFNLDMIVDAMSSFAGVPIDMKEMNIKYLISSSNKCIQAMAGVSFVIAEKSALEKIKGIKKRNLYLNLYQQYKYFEEKHQMRFTPPVQILYALKQAIIEAREETLEVRSERYKNCCRELCEGLDKLKLKRLIPDEDSSMLLTTVIEPAIKGYDFKKMHDYLYERGFTIYPGKLAMKNTFRIANIGQIYVEDIRNFINALSEYFISIVN